LTAGLEKPARGNQRTHRPPLCLIEFNQSAPIIGLSGRNGPSGGGLDHKRRVKTMFQDSQPAIRRGARIFRNPKPVHPKTENQLNRSCRKSSLPGVLGRPLKKRKPDTLPDYTMPSIMALIWSTPLSLGHTR
jgi:hypothetical protein